MCLTVKGFPTKKETLKYKKEGEILDKDLLVYKVLDLRKGRYFTPFKNMEYTQGFHYYQEGKAFSFSKLYSALFTDDFRFQVEKGLHSYSSKRNAVESCAYYNCINPRVIRMVIPKGSKIYRGTGGDIVSDNLIWY